MRISGPKTDPFFSKSRTYELHENRPFLRGIQNDHAYPFYVVGVAGPGGGGGGGGATQLENHGFKSFIFFIWV